VPSHRSSVHGLPSSAHGVPLACLPSAGQASLVPVQLSAASHAPAAGRQITLEDANVQLAVQHDPAAPFAAPRSHCSSNGAADCTSPSPQNPA
jgi:hypothetical protein